METILHEDQYILIYIISFLALFTCFYGNYNKHYLGSIFAGCIFLTSVTYWLYPIHDWRRVLDIFVVKTLIGVQFLTSFGYKNAIFYYIVTILGILCYPIGIYFYKIGDWWSSTYAHIMVHVLINIGHLILFSESL